MDEKVVRFDLSAETLIGLAEKKLDEKDYVGALRILRKSVEENGATADEYAVFADIYDEMELFENAVNYWFRFLDVCAEDEVVDGYEGLAACFYNMGNERQAIYYYNLMLQDKYVSAENNIEMGELFSEPAKKRFRIVYPPEEADYSEELDEGLSALRSGDFAKSDEIFSAVPQGASCYGAARNFYALSKLMQGNAEEAEAVCRARLAEDGEDVSVLATYAAALTELGRKEESRRTAQKLASLPAASADELYKIATVCCENGLYGEAYEKFCILEEQVRYDLTLLYFKAVAAFKDGRIKESLAGFAKIVDIYPDAAVARYYFGEIRRFAEEGGEPPETGFFYRVPQKERETRVKFMAALCELPQPTLRAFLQEADIGEYIDWSLDEADGADAELMLLGIRLAVKAGMDEKVRDIMLDCSVNDVLKPECLRLLCERNKPFEAGVVIADIYRNAAFYKLEVGRTRRAKFIEAYALAFSRFAFLSGEDCTRYKEGAESIYAALEREEKLTLASDAASLACAICFVASKNVLKRMPEILKAMGGSAPAVAEILHALNKFAEQEAAAATSSEEEGGGGKGE